MQFSRELENFDANHERLDLEDEGGGWFSGWLLGAGAGVFYKFLIEEGSYPDPASRFQPAGPHGPSQVVDPQFAWTDAAWSGVSREGQVIYEMHIGTFTPEGTSRAAMAQLPELADLGVTVLEIMPVAEACGRFGWGYDGVDLFAPTHRYGTPDDFRTFVNRAHELGIGVILDVVYNHLGPDGNYLRPFSDDYFSTRYMTEWGEAMNFDGPNRGPVREFFVANARHWIDEYHLDGLRIDATQQIFDDSEEHILVVVARAVREAAGGRSTWIIAENEPQDARLLRPPERGGFGLDAMWNDDFHHSAMVALTGHSEAYYSDYRGRPQEFISAAKRGFLYQGQWYLWQKKPRGSPALDVHPCQFVVFLQNHDQVANSLRGQRIHELTSPGRLRAMTALLLLGPSTPMLFQGQEFAASTPFLYFADHRPQLAARVKEGRGTFLRQFPRIAAPECGSVLADPEDEETFRRSKLDFADRQRNAATYRLHRDLLRLRREDAVISRGCHLGIDGAVLGDEAFLLRYFADGGDRLLLVNLGPDLALEPAPEPLLAPPADSRWEIVWSSENPDYGGGGTPPPDRNPHWWLPAACAVLLRPVPESATPSTGCQNNGKSVS